MDTKLTSIAARADLKPRGKPYETPIVPHLRLGYRAGSGAWMAIIADGKGGRTVERIGVADTKDVEADGLTVLSYEQAIDKARLHANARKGGHIKPARTLDEVLTRYALDLKNRGKSATNATTPRGHLTSALLATPVDKITSAALEEWRQDMINGGLKKDSLNRYMKPIRAALDREAKYDGRVAANAKAWKDGLEIFKGVNQARNAVLKAAEVRKIVAAAYDLDPAFGLFVQAHAELGARTSQIVRTTVRDLKGDRLLVPTSRKGDGERKPEHTAVPITPGLAAALAAAAKGREPDAPLFLKADGSPWIGADYRRPFDKAAAAAGLPKAFIYALRHSSIARMLEARVPIAFVAKVHDTSVQQIQAHYARFIVDHYDELLRAALLDTTPGANIVLGSFPQSA
jgi:integrase